MFSITLSSPSFWIFTIFIFFVSSEGMDRFVILGFLDFRAIDLIVFLFVSLDFRFFLAYNGL